LLRPLSLITAVVLLTLVGPANLGRASIASAPESVAALLSVKQEDARTFQIAHHDAPPVRVTFLTPTVFRMHVLAGGDDSQLTAYMRVKSDSAYPRPAVQLETSPDALTFSTSTMIVRFALDHRLISLNVRAGAVNLIENWRIDATARTAGLDLRAYEHIYGFGDKRASLDQRGQRIEMLNRDAYASESNDSYKSIPFYMSTAGYGLFFQLPLRPGAAAVRGGRRDTLPFSHGCSVYSPPALRRAEGSDLIPRPRPRPAEDISGGLQRLRTNRRAKNVGVSFRKPLQGGGGAALFRPMDIGRGTVSTGRANLIQ